MSEQSLDTYRSADAALPATMLRWHLYGPGLENMGREGQPEVVDVPRYGADELLVRQDACGLCFSDTKVIGLGANHPRMTGRDLAQNPVTLGHEVSVTVVSVGDTLADRFHVGDRFVVQADVFYQGKSMAYGYAISGGLAEYSVIPRAVIEGDEGCYLLPIRADTGYVESALTEPWACVVSAYAQSHRSGPKEGGTLLVIGSKRDVDYTELLRVGPAPGAIAIISPEDAAAPGADGSATLPDFLALRENSTGGRGFDDIWVTGPADAALVEAAATVLADNGVLCFLGDPAFTRKLSIDIGRVHYNRHHYLGAVASNVKCAFSESRGSELLPGGLAWFIGAGGPMGQMHVQRAIQLRNPPRLIVASDVDTVRLDSVRDRFGAMAAERGIDLVILNPDMMTAAGFDSALKAATADHGFDDIVSMVPIAKLIEQAADYLAPAGWFNIFAGVARGTMAQLDMNRVVRDGVRYIGSSGSSLSDMRETLARVESDELSTNASLAAIGGMEAARTGLQAVKEGWFPGKTLIFPLIHNLPLTPISELKDSYPSVYAKLKEGQFWTNEAEEELLRLTVAQG